MELHGLGFHFFSHMLTPTIIFSKIDTNVAKTDRAVFDLSLLWHFLPLDGILIDEQHKNVFKSRSASQS